MEAEFFLTAVILAFGIWFAVCNERTFRFRMKLLDSIPFDGNAVVQIRRFGAVSYGEHMAMLLTFRNPKKLYDPRLLALLGD